MVQVVFSDIAGTIVAGNPWTAIRQHPLYNQEQGKRQMRRFLPIYAARKLRLMSDTNFRHQWLVHMAAGFAGLRYEDILTIYRETVQSGFTEAYQQDVIARLRQHKANGAVVVMVSGMFVELVQAFAEYVGADDALGSRMEFEDGIATGRVVEPTCVGPRKLEFIRDYLTKHYPSVSLAECYGYADSYSDRALLGAVGHGVATYPEARVRNLAQRNGWEIIPA